MTVRELREKYLRFFESKGHQRFPAASLVPYDVTGRLDESLLFTGAGMIQFKPFFRGVARPDHLRLITCQPCVRTGDIDEIGDDTHLSFFEMLGNFSFGDYFKAQAIAFSWEFLTDKQWLGLDPRRLSCSIFEEDEDAYNEWAFWLTPAGINPSSRIVRLGEESNYWPAGAFSAGPPGPCGPNSEMFYWTSKEEPPGNDYTQEDWVRDEAAGKWVEIWNDVFIQYEWQGHLKDPSNSKLGYEKDGMPELPFKSIDTGMGLDRTAIVLGGHKSIYEIDVFQPILTKIRDLRGAGVPPAGSREERAERIVADHLRTASFCIADGILPGNTGRGYVLRRLIRRATLQGQRVLGFEEPFLHVVYEGLVESMGDFYTSLIDRREMIVETLRNEETLFRRTLSEGIKKLQTEFGGMLFEEMVAAKLRASEETEQGEESSSGKRLLTLLPIEARNLIFDNTISDQPVLGRIQVQPDGGEPNIVAYSDFASQNHVRRLLQQIWKELGQAADIYSQLSGEDAFRLYDTFGFPLEVTQELAEEAGVVVDLEGYEKALRAAQARSRGAQGDTSAYGKVTAAEELTADDAPGFTTFLGYTGVDSEARIVRIRPAGDGLLIALDRTPFYAESGGQTGDHGTLILTDGNSLAVTNTTKSGGTFWHHVSATELKPEALLGQTVRAQVLGARRDRIRRNHTATHLLQAALRQTLGTHVAQAGSYVGPDNLRFDFTHGKAMTPEEIERVERSVNEQALANTEVTTYVDLPIDEARAKGAMALFGEKYGDRVRMVEIGDFSRELCGGIHVRTTGEIGLFKIVGEASAASGVRRIEAITGEAAYEWVLEETKRLREAAALLKASPRELVPAIERTVEAAKEERRRREKAEMASMGGGTATAERNDTIEVGPVVLWRRNFGDVDPKLAANAVDNAAAEKPNQVTLAAVVSNGKPQFICKCGADAVTAGAHAGNLLREVAKIAGGGGGGRPDFATAGGREPGKVDEALESAAKLLATMVGVSAD